MFKSLFFILTLLSVQTIASPSARETQDWINSKLLKYSDDTSIYADSGADYTWFQGDGPVISFSECHMTTQVELRKRSNGKSSYSYERHESFPLKEIKRIFYIRKDRETYTGYPRLVVEHNYNAGTRVNTHTRRGKTYRSATSEMDIHFNYNNQESNLVNRLENAFLHLAKIARENPRCNESEPF
ncbi:hypothetical protein HBN50_00935 [Halobacteriovorax sp. GB3]|uniref:hypothetical protein n=1 Tax=Halobacteriovorax sp. GB3 TaxID=2719615 RepID=UPI00235F13EF|nr:hypothetical protein [Halobacteriovorax sp. GB3]MDD0851631.1 hypothetical protein [Halobacteriovorax sp. GB3]